MKRLKIKIALNFIAFMIIGAILVIIENQTFNSVKLISIPIVMGAYFGMLYLGFYFLRIRECAIIGTIVVSIFFIFPILIYAYMIWFKYIYLDFLMLKWIFYYIFLYLSATYYGKKFERSKSLD